MTYGTLKPSDRELSVARTSTAHNWLGSARDAGLVFGLILAASLIGILTRPTGLMAAIWPANALLLGLFVRWPKLATPLGWAAATAAFLAADLITGSTLIKTTLLTAGNVVSVGVGVILYMEREALDRGLKRPISILYMCGIAGAAAAGAGVLGALVNPALFNGSALMGAIFWFVTEFVNYIAVLPVILTLPDLRASAGTIRMDRRLLLSRVPPLVALIAACIASLWIGGPGALAFPVPALLWCALTFGLHGTTVVTLLFSVWTLAAISTGAIPVGDDFNSIESMLSIRIAVALVAVAQITVASILAAQSEFQVLLQRMVTNDPLTAALTRRAFTIRSRNLLALDANSGANVALLLMDISRFKQINAVYGHAVGDEVLQTLSRIARAALPTADDFGRLGGTEFAVLLPDCDREEAARLASEICGSFAEKIATLARDPEMRPTVNIGIALACRAPLTVEPLLAQADRSLTRAKAAGINQFAFVSEEKDVRVGRTAG
jgi:diguanylate cyclase (GGDEF)-like protein